MLRLFGEISLITALIFSFFQSFLPLLGYRQQNIYLMAFARPAAWGQFVFVVLAYMLLTVAFATNDFSIAYVAANSHPDLPLMYRLTATWGAHEGSILLWILILNIWTFVFPFFNKDSELTILTVAILGLINLSFLSFLLLTSNPFVAASGIQSGFDLNPLLQDPGFVTHPPMLYTGYVGFSVAFALTQAGLLRKRLDQHWAFITRRFALAAWCFLTLGITLGSWWAYRVLGWGGFWFWDPVENASLLPWITGTALVHMLILCEKRQAYKAWTSLLAIICFALSLLGTFLVRSGVLVSAHTFASDPARGIFLLLLLACLATAALTLYVSRLSHLDSKPINFILGSRETALLLNSALMIIAVSTILLGTIYPLILDALQLGTISVGAPYFNSVMGPLVLIIMAFMAYGAFCKWNDNLSVTLRTDAIKKLGISIISATVLLWSVTGDINLFALTSLTLSFWIIMSVIGFLRFSPGMFFAHAGFAILVIGVMLSSILNQQSEVRVRPGDGTMLGPYQFFFINDKEKDGPNYRGVQAEFEVLKNGRHITNLYPEKRIYTVRQMVMTKVDIDPSIFRDLYLALGDPMPGNYWSVRIYYKPFIRWIWCGGLIMILGGILTIAKRKRV